MKLDFQQGIVSYSGTPTVQSFLSITGSYVSIQTVNGRIDLTLAAGVGLNYLVTIATDVPGAWGPIPSATDVWLYWDVNMLTGVVSYNFTLAAPITSAIRPSSPVQDVHWFDSVNRKMFVYQGSSFRQVLRVFAAKLNNTTFTPLGNGYLMKPYAGTQVGANAPGSVSGRILFDNVGSPVRHANGTFITTEDDMFVNGSPVNTIRLEANVVSATSKANMGRFQVVKYAAFGVIDLASYNDTESTAIAMVMEDLVYGQTGTVCMQGVITNPAWSWSTVGKPLWISSLGDLSEVDLHLTNPASYPVAKVPVGRVLTPTSIFFDQGMGAKGLPGTSGAATSTPADTLNMGSVRLSVDSATPESPAAAGDNDPRLSDARTPLAHIHVISDVTGLQDALDGAGITSNGVFILDAIPTATGIVGDKTYKSTVPAGTVLLTAIADTANVDIVIGVAGNADGYSPVVTVNGVNATLTETSTKRWFSGVASITLDAGDTVVTVDDAGGGTDVATITLAGPGPDIQSIAFGAYPGTQTELKAGDTIGVTVVADVEATTAVIQVGGAAASLVNLTLTATPGTFTGTIAISSATGAQTVASVASNSLGTAGNSATSPALSLNQTYPTIAAITAAYPGVQTALQTGNTVDLTATVTNADVFNYSGAGLTIPSTSTYAATKTVGHTLSGYTTATYTITATRTANAAVSTANRVVSIATIAPTAAITITGNPVRLVSSPTGVNYTVNITPSQTPLQSAPTLTASAGVWSGSWTFSGGAWSRILVIADATTRGAATFSALTMTGPSGLAGTVITSSSTYIVGGLTLRTLTYAAFSRVAAIGADVGDQTKTSAQYTGGSVLTRYTDNTVHVAGFYIANSDGTFNANGLYLGLSDTAFANANTSGTLQVDFQEVA